MNRVPAEHQVLPRARREQLLARLGPPLLLIMAVGVSLRPGLENDAWWHLASGRWMLQERTWLRTDVFSWTMQGEPWPRPGLLADVSMAVVHAAGGIPLLVVVASALFVAAVAITLLTTEASPLATFAVGVLSILTMVVSATPRPLIASLPLTAICVVILQWERSSATGTRWLWALPLLAALWVNIHGAFIVVFALIGCHGLAWLLEAFRGAEPAWRKRLGRLVVAGVLGLLTVTVNPFGAAMLTYPVETLRLDVLAVSVHEWRRPTLRDPQFWPLFALLAVGVAALLRSGERRRPSDIVVLVVFGTLAASAARHGSIFAVVAWPIIARLSSRGETLAIGDAWAASTRRERVLDVGVVASLVALTATVAFPAITVDGNDRAIEAFHGDQAVARAASGDLPGRLWNSYDLGGHVIWLGKPEVLVSIDSRTDLHGDEAVLQHLADWNGPPGVARRFDEQGIRTVLVERWAPLVAILEAEGWQRVVEDQLAVVLRKPSAP
jgi:hypothetical protein